MRLLRAPVAATAARALRTAPATDPKAGTYSRAILNRLLIDRSWASSHLEGNTYSRLAANLPLFRANLCPLTFLDVPADAYSHATLGVYELTRVELLRDLYVWAYERSIQEYQSIQQDLTEPDPTRLAYRDLIKQTVREVVQQPQADPLQAIERALEPVPQADRADVHALLVQELQRLLEGVLARYGLRPSELEAWKIEQGAL